VKLAFVTTRVPYPMNSGGRIRSFHLLHEVSKVHDVTLVSACETREEEDALAAVRAAIPRLAARVTRVRPRGNPRAKLLRILRTPFDPLPYTWAGFCDPLFAENVKGAVSSGRFDLIHCDHVQVAATLLGLDTPPRVLNAHNVEALLLRRVAERAGRVWRRAFFTWQAAKARRAEAQAFDGFDHCVAVSEPDADEIRHSAPGLPVSIVPNGVDIDWFRPDSHRPEPGRLVFVGAMDWLPNADAVCFFAAEVLPLVRRQAPEAELLVIGRNPGSLERRIAADGVRFTGTVDDIRPHLQGAGLVVVPLRIGGGTRLKILESWSMAKAVVSTSIGAEGLPVRDGENIAIADRPDEMAERIVQLLRDPPAAERLGREGRRAVLDRFSWPKVAAALLFTYEQVVAGGPVRSRRT
jgi:glycosyltransferase involved in cell wall biosynthesis